MARRFFSGRGMTVLETDSRSGKGVNGFSKGAVRTAPHDKIGGAYAAKGQVGARDACHGARYPRMWATTVYQSKVARRGGRRRPAGRQRGKQGIGSIRGWSC